MNYNHFQNNEIIVRIRKLESICPERYKMSENHTWYAHLSQFFQKKTTQKADSATSVILNSTTATESLHVYFIQCTWLSTCIKSIAFHNSYFCYLAQSLPVQKANSALFEWHGCYSPCSYTLHPAQPNFYFYKTFSFTSLLFLFTWHKVHPTNGNDDCRLNVSGLPI